MSTKRDRLKKMRDEHKNLMNEETPAEEYIEAAASYHKETAAAQKQERTAATVPVRKQEPVESEVQPETPPAPTEPQAVQEPIAPVVSPQPATVQIPPISATTQQAVPTPPVRAAAPVSYQPVETVKEDVRPSRNVPYTVANEPGKRISVSLRIENKNWMHRTALRCGLSIQDYMNILIEEAWLREQSSPYLWNEDDPIPERIPSSKTILVAVKLTNVNIERSQRMRAARCMTMTYYMNYLIEEEIKREQLQGMRRAIFD